jgi:phage terminase large subunit-like protein
VKDKDFAAIAEGYIGRVMSGEELVCRKVRLTVERHVRDLQAATDNPDFPFYFDPKAGSRVCRLFEMVRPSKWPSTMVMAPWMVACTLLLYGWKQKSDRLRRFRQAFLMWPRKMGKSAYLSVGGLHALRYDGERGAEVYSAALVEEQARRVFDEAVAMRDGTPELRGDIVKQGASPTRALRVTETASVFRPLSRDKESMEGLNISYAACDEIHKWKGRGAWDVIRYGMRSRQQPLLVGITTAPSADDTTSICNTLYEYAEKVLTGVIPDDRFFPWITELDGELRDEAGNVLAEADRWDDETKWVKACPNLGVTVKVEDMRQEALEASADPESLNAFMRYSLNIRVDAKEQVIGVKMWDRCASLNSQTLGVKRARTETVAALKGRICFAGLDLALTDDTSALVLIFPATTPTEITQVVPYFWIPENNIRARVEKHSVPYDVWQELGFLVTTPGDVTDYDFISGEILDIAKQFDLRELAYDPALASGLINKVLAGQKDAAGRVVQAGLKKERVVKFGQTALNYAAPCGDFVRAIARREIVHDGNPVLRWQATNLRWKKNHTGLIMPDKEKSIEKIDGMAAAIMAYGRATHPDNAKLLKPKPSVSTL